MENGNSGKSRRDGKGESQALKCSVTEPEPLHGSYKPRQLCRLLGPSWCPSAGAQRRCLRQPDIIVCDRDARGGGPSPAWKPVWVEKG